MVSQPADVILTRLANEPHLGISHAAVSLWREGQAGEMVHKLLVSLTLQLEISGVILFTKR